MRALFVASPMIGHVPLAAAFRDAGHDVVMATGADGVGAARTAGLPVHDVAPGVSVNRVFAGALLRHPPTSAGWSAGTAARRAWGSRSPP